MQHVFVALVEVRPRGNCRRLDPTNVNGACVRAYIPARDEASARIGLDEYFIAHELEVIETEWFVREDEVEWERRDDPDGRQAIDEARRTGEIVTSEFHTWGHDAPDATN